MRVTPVTALLAVCLSPLAQAQYLQQGLKLVSAGSGGLGSCIAVSADGNTAVLGGPSDSGLTGAIWVFVRNNGTWTQQGPKLVGAGPNVTLGQGTSVAISADGNTILEGDDGGTGGAFVFTRTNGVWTQQGGELTGTNGFLAGEGSSVALSADGNTAFIGGSGDNFAAGAFWIFTRSGGSWTQVGNKVTGAGATGAARLAGSMAVSSDGGTVVVGGSSDANDTGAAWVFTRSNGGWVQQGPKLVGAGATSKTFQNTAVAISADGNTIILGRDLDNNNTGAAWIFTRTNGAWAQQGSKLVGTGAVGQAHQGASVALSGDGNTAVIGGTKDNTLHGATWVFQRSGGVWNQLGNKLTATNGGGFEGSAEAISADAGTIVVGAPANGGVSGAAFVFLGPSSVVPTPGVTTPASGGGFNQQFTFNFYDAGGWQKFTVLDVLINNAIDGRQACYIAFQPTGPNSGSLFLVDDAGDAGGPYQGLSLPSTQSVNNSQCTISGAGSSVSAAGTTVTLTLAISFSPSFAGNKIFYIAAQDTGANSGWQPQGTWNVPGTGLAGPGVTGMTNAYSIGLTQTYTFTFTDSKGWQDITVANVLINSAINGVGACYIAFLPAGAGSGAIDLVDNAGDAAGPYQGLTLPSTSAVSNGQCTISGAGSSVTASGTTLQLTLAVTFTPGFGGNRIVYAAAGSATQNSGWQAIGTVLVQ